MTAAPPSSPVVSSLRAERWRLRAANARGFARRFVRRGDGVAGALILLVFTVVAIAPQLFVGPLQTATTATGLHFEPPSDAHVFGTDELGRDLLNLTFHGARISMAIGLLATFITILVGALIGIVAGFLGGWVDNALMRLTD